MAVLRTAARLRGTRTWCPATHAAEPCHCGATYGGRTHDQRGVLRDAPADPHAAWQASGRTAGVEARVAIVPETGGRDRRCEEGPVPQERQGVTLAPVCRTR